MNRPDAGRRSRDAEIEVTACPRGPLLVRGAATVRGPDGGSYEVTRPVVALCACGLTQRAPWCDGTHKSVPRRDRPLP